jgi:hypothetical protein
MAILNGKIVKFKKASHIMQGYIYRHKKKKSIEETLIQKNTEIEALYEIRGSK